jgi:hypothetical protein
VAGVGSPGGYLVYLAAISSDDSPETPETIVPIGDSDVISDMPHDGLKTVHFFAATLDGKPTTLLIVAKRLVRPPKPIIDASKVQISVFYLNGGVGSGSSFLEPPRFESLDQITTGQSFSSADEALRATLGISRR